MIVYLQQGMNAISHKAPTMVCLLGDTQLSCFFHFLPTRDSNLFHCLFQFRLKLPRPLFPQHLRNQEKGVHELALTFTLKKMFVLSLALTLFCHKLKNFLPTQ